MSKQWASGTNGAFKRQVSSFRETISKQHPIYKPAKGRYWLYVSLACPWAHRTLITRALKGLTSVIGCSVVHWHLDEKGWRFLDMEKQLEDSEDFLEHWHDVAGGIRTAKEDSSKSFAEIKNDSQRFMLMLPMSLTMDTRESVTYITRAILNTRQGSPSQSCGT